MHSREKISLVLRSRLPRRHRKTKGPDPSFVIGVTRISRFAKQISKLRALHLL